MSIVVARTCTIERNIVSYELVYKCDKCGKEYWFSSKYPKVTYISLD